MHYALWIMYYALCTRHYVLCTMQGWAHRGHSGMENPRKTGVGCGATPPAIFLHRRICKLWYPKGQRRDSPEVRGTLTRNQQCNGDHRARQWALRRRGEGEQRRKSRIFFSACLLVYCVYLSTYLLDLFCKRDNRSNNWQTQNDIFVNDFREKDTIAMLVLFYSAEIMKAGAGLQYWLQSKPQRSQRA